MKERARGGAKLSPAELQRGSSIVVSLSLSLEEGERAGGRKEGRSAVPMEIQSSTGSSAGFPYSCFLTRPREGDRATTGGGGNCKLRQGAGGRGDGRGGEGVPSYRYEM